MFRTDDLRQAVKTLYSLVPNRTTMPILQTIALKTRNGRLELTANDLEKSLTLFLDCDKEYDVCIPAKILNELLAVITSSEIDIDQKDTNIVVNRKPGKTKISTMPTDDFPVTTFDAHHIIDIDATTFAEALKKCLISISEDDSHPVMTGVLLKSVNGILTIASVDGFRMSYTELMFGLPDFEIIVKGDAIKILLSVLNSGKAKLGINESKIAFYADDFIFTAQLVAGNFPDVKRLLPVTWETEIEIDKTVLNKATKTAMIFARDAANVVTLDFTQDKITVTGESKETGNDVTVIESFKITGNNVKTSVNGNYLLQALTLASDRVILKLNDWNRPIGLFLPEDSTFVHIMMPMHLGR